MTYKGQVYHGQVIFDDPINLPDGTPVQIEVLASSQTSAYETAIPSLAERLSSLVGKASDLPVDAAREHDHYLYGTPRESDRS